MTQGEMFSDLALEQQYDNMIKALDMKQSSIEWLAVQIMDNWNDITAGARDIAEFIDKAKAMHREEIIDAWIAVDNPLQRIAAEKYYNKTFKSE